MDTNRDERGRFTLEHTDEEVLAAVRAHEPAATSEVGDELGVSRQAADYRLRQLRDEGRVASKKIGASLVWFGPSEASPEDRADVDIGAGRTDEIRDSRRSSTPEPSSSTGGDARPLSSYANDDILAAVEFPRSRDRDECLAAVLAARDYLREYGHATMREIVADVMPEHPVGYNVPDLKPGDRYRGAWWRLVVKPGLKALPDVQTPSRGASDWRYHPNPDTEAEPNG